MHFYKLFSEDCHTPLIPTRHVAGCGDLSKLPVIIFYYVQLFLNKLYPVENSF